MRKTEYMKHLDTCLYNDWVDCEDCLKDASGNRVSGDACKSCGWNPKVQDARKTLNYAPMSDLEVLKSLLMGRISAATARGIYLKTHGKKALG